MKKFLKGLFLVSLTILQLSVFGQQDLKHAGNEVKSWFSQNWQWVTGIGVILLIIITASARMKTNRKTTTIVKDDYGNTKSVTSTEIIE